MEYNFRTIEKKWQQQWQSTNAYRIDNPKPEEENVQPKCYVLDMFPYPSGAGLHVGHPLGYIASDIYARFKRHKGFKVLHPMGYDAFGLPAEQYAIEHGIHPAVSTQQNIDNFRRQLDNIGFSYDWSREINTSNKSYYKWTQWIFLKLFNSYINRQLNKAEPLDKLIEIFEKEGNPHHPIIQVQHLEHGVNIPAEFNATQWKSFDEATRQQILMQYRLAYCGYGEVNWCEALGTVLANDEVVNGFSERGGHPVTKKKLRQWYLRITDYAERLLAGLDKIDFSDAMKEMQSNWIGKSSGAEIDFRINGSNKKLKVYTTRPDTIFGVDFMVVAPELDIISEIVTEEQEEKVAAYLHYVHSRSERERIAEKEITGCFTGSYAINPFDYREIPIYISEYVLAGYGTGAIMAVPCGDERDFKFARHFDIPITNILGDAFNAKEANSTKDAELHNSNFITGMLMRDAIKIMLQEIESLGIGKKKINYKMRDAAFSRQRYWGEPIPIKWEQNIPIPLDENMLPLELPVLDEIKPGKDGESPLVNVSHWTAQHLETNTMPGYAGSSWYFLRYMDPDNDEVFCDKNISDYWNQVDMYIGGTEHAVGHLLYSRMWTKVLYDLGYISFDEPFKKLVNQGMIQGSSRFVYRILPTQIYEAENQNKKHNELIPVFISQGIYNKIINDETDSKDLLIELSETLGINKDFIDANRKQLDVQFSKLHVDVHIVDGVVLDMLAFRNWKQDYEHAVFVCEDGTVHTTGVFNKTDAENPVYICGAETEKMSKSKLNTVNPDEIVEKYGADTFRMYEMFLGPVEQSKPWDTKGIEGVHRFLKKLWRLFYDEQKGALWNNNPPDAAEYKVLHKAIKKIEDDTEKFSFNTAVSAFMVCVNELTDVKCHKAEILSSLLILISPYAPHIAEELWHALDNKFSILDEAYPTLNTEYLIETAKEYPVSINGKLRTTISIGLEATQKDVERIVLENAIVQKWVESKPVKKFVFVKGKMINVVI